MGVRLRLAAWTVTRCLSLLLFLKLGHPPSLQEADNTSPTTSPSPPPPSCSPNRRKATPHRQCVLRIPRNHLSTYLRHLCPTGPLCPPPPPLPSNEPQTPLPLLEPPPIFSAVYHNLAKYN